LDLVDLEHMGLEKKTRARKLRAIQVFRSYLFLIFLIGIKILKIK
jgi:hypothetical protein